MVSKLEPDIIKKAIQSFINEEDDAYCSKIYHTASILNLKDLNEVLDSQQKRAMGDWLSKQGEFKGSITQID